MSNFRTQTVLPNGFRNNKAFEDIVTWRSRKYTFNKNYKGNPDAELHLYEWSDSLGWRLIQIHKVGDPPKLWVQYLGVYM